MTPSAKCVIHCRVSTGRQASEGESLETQQRICRGIAESKGWTLAHQPWLEAYTGTSNVRPVFEEVLDFIDAHPGAIRYYIFRAIDRFTRGGAFPYLRMKERLAERGVELVDSFGIIQPTINTLAHLGFEYRWSRSSPSEISELVMATTAKAEVSTILTRLIGQEIALTQRGYRARGAEDGYRNQRVYIDGKRRYIQVADPDRASYYRAMFDLRAAGQLSDKEIVARVNAMGYRRRTFRRWNADRTQIVGTRGGGPLTVARLQEIILRPIFCGIVWEKWTDWKAVRAPYQGLVSIETWNAANRGKRFIREASSSVELLHDYHPSSRKRILTRNNPEYPFKSVVVCPSCRGAFRGSATRGRSGRRFPAYHCARGHKRIGIGKADFDAAVKRFIGHLHAQPALVPAMAAALLSRYDERKGTLGNAALEVAHSASELEAQKVDAVRAFIGATTDAMRAALEGEVARLDQELAKAEAEHAHIAITEAELDDYIQAMGKLLEHPALLLEEPVDKQAQRSRFDLAFDQLPTITELEDGTAKLTPIFSLCERVRSTESGLAGVPELDWNQVERAVLRWKNDSRQ